MTIAGNEIYELTASADSPAGVDVNTRIFLERIVILKYTKGSGATTIQITDLKTVKTIDFTISVDGLTSAPTIVPSSIEIGVYFPNGIEAQFSLGGGSDAIDAMLVFRRDGQTYPEQTPSWP